MVVHNTEMYHTWNLVKLDGKWYHTDVYSDAETGNYANFNMNDDIASAGHDWNMDFFPGRRNQVLLCIYEQGRGKRYIRYP